MAMTVAELYSMAKSLMFEKVTSKDYDNYYIPITNDLLSHEFELNNQLRVFKGKDPLEEIPQVKNPSDELPYEDEINRKVLPYGMAARFFIDDDLSKYDIYNTDYQNAIIQLMPCVEEDIKDVYGGGE